VRPRWTPGQWALRATMVVGVLVALLTTGIVGTWPRWWLVLLVTGLAIGWALIPEAPMGTVAMAVVLAWWGIGLRDGLHPAALAAAAGLLAAHLAGIVAAYGPDRMAVDAATVRLWVRRGLLVLPLAPVAWLVGTLVRNQPEPEGMWLAGLAAALASCLAASLALTLGQDRR
jgi:hypothetical protein